MCTTIGNHCTGVIIRKLSPSLGVGAGIIVAVGMITGPAGSVGSSCASNMLYKKATVTMAMIAAIASRVQQERVLVGDEL